MDKSKSSTMRVALIFLAIASVVLGVVQVIRLSGSSEEDKPQADLSGYGTQTDTENSDGLIFEDDATMEMDSIPNEAMTSGTDVSGADVSGTDTSSADVVPAG